MVREHPGGCREIGSSQAKIEAVILKMSVFLKSVECWSQFSMFSAVLKSRFIMEQQVLKKFSKSKIQIQNSEHQILVCSLLLLFLFYFTLNRFAKWQNRIFKNDLRKSDEFRCRLLTVVPNKAR